MFLTHNKNAVKTKVFTALLSQVSPAAFCEIVGITAKCQNFVLPLGDNSYIINKNINIKGSIYK